MQIDRSVVAALTPTGTLRASINLGNPILAGTDAATGEPFGLPSACRPDWSCWSSTLRENRSRR